MMRMKRVMLLVLTCLLSCVDVVAQRLDVKGVRKRSDAADCATIMFKSDCDELTITSLSNDSVYKKKDCGYSHVWVSYVDLRFEREHGPDSLINRSFRLHTPYTEDVELTVPGKDKELRQAIYEYKVRIFDYFPFRVACEVDLVRIRDYYGLRISAGKRWGGYASFKFGSYQKEGFDADGYGEELDVSKKSYLGRIRNSYMAGVKYGIASRDFPVYIYAGIGYGDNGSQRSNGKKKGKSRVAYYTNYTNGFESEIGANVILFYFFSISMGADAIFGHRIAFDINCTLGFAIDLAL